MADEKNEETTEQAPEEAAAEAPEGTTPEAASGDAAPASGGTPSRPSKAERRAAKSKPRPRTPEERQEARRHKAKIRRAYRARLKQRRAERRAAEPAREPDRAAEPSGRRKVRQGVVISDKADKTIVVRIDVANRHRRYRKVLRTSTTLHAHDETNDASTGDIVRVVETRPLSRTKHWRLVEVLERAK
jgi:small subunit ribosomal protein S17